MAAPVVPIQDAKNVPTSKISVFIKGVPTNVPLSLIPPEIVYKANNNIIKGKYSNKKHCP